MNIAALLVVLLSTAFTIPSSLGSDNIRVELGQNLVTIDMDAKNAPWIQQLEGLGHSDTIHLPERCTYQDGVCLSSLQLDDENPSCLIYFYDQFIDFYRLENLRADPQVILNDSGEAQVLHGYILQNRATVAYFSCNNTESLGINPQEPDFKDIINRSFGEFLTIR